ncbi:MAG: EamA family transporter [Lachnospiraceae bacterium]|nr:EamA family transporter [Lachnospiraceae bacterium]
MIWMSLVLLYGLLKGARELAKKKAMESNSVMEVLFLYTLLSFVFVSPGVLGAWGMAPKYYGLIAVKSFVIFLAWIFSFKALSKLPVSLYGIFDLSRVLFSTFLAVTVLGETVGFVQSIGLVFVCLGLLLMKFRHKKKNGAGTTDTDSVPMKYFILALASCMLNSVSALLDKVLLKDVTDTQVQFWYMLFLVIFYAVYILVRREKISKKAFKNKWIWLLAVMFVIGDKALFIANKYVDSRLAVMTLLKQCGCFVAIVGGKFIFKEKDIRYKLFCTFIIFVGIFLGAL